MSRTITCIALVVLALGRGALADEPPPPTKDQLELAKKAFEDGNALYKAGKLVEAIVKLKESYKLSRNPFLLYNIGHTYDQLGQKEQALFYFRKFLAAAPADAPMRPDVIRRVAEFDKDGVPETDPDAPKVAPPTTPDKPIVEIVHTPVEAAEPNKPVELTAVVPKDPPLTVTLFYRRSDEATFTSVPMTPRETDLVAQIPGDKMQGNYVQYYIEARDQANAVVARVGKSTSPNLINILGGPTRSGLELDDPLTVHRDVPVAKPPTPYFKETWISTAAAGTLITTSIIMYALAKKESDALRDDATGCGTPPCTVFDEAYDQRLQTLGKRYSLAYKITLVLGVGAAGTAGYFWYRRVTAKKAAADDKRWAIAPIVGDDFAGAATVGSF